MDVTDIPSVKAPREDRPDSCLYCVLMTAIEDWFTRHGQRAPDGRVIVDLNLVIGKLAECMVEHTAAAGNRSDRRRAFRFAHEALDAVLKSIWTGKLVSVDIPSEH